MTVYMLTFDDAVKISEQLINSLITQFYYIFCFLLTCYWKISHHVEPFSVIIALNKSFCAELYAILHRC